MPEPLSLAPIPDARPQPPGVHDWRVTSLLRHSGPLTRAQLAHRMLLAWGASAAITEAAVARLTAAGTLRRNDDKRLEVTPDA